MSAVGQASYSLYLLHPAVLGLTVLAAKAGRWPPIASASAAILGAVAVALLAYRVIERPFLARAKPATSSPETATAAAE
jgi:peptidoglycan/LPS O-acetylase OafA/YrhL